MIRETLFQKLLQNISHEKKTAQNLQLILSFCLDRRAKKNEFLMYESMFSRWQPTPVFVLIGATWCTKYKIDQSC